MYKRQALVFGNAYCVVKLVHGEAVFALPAARQAGSGGPAAPESGASAPAQPAASGSGQSTAQSGAASASGSTAQAADGRAWNTAARAERTLYSERTAQDARMLSVPENGIVSLEYFRTALFIGDSLTEGFGEYKPLQGIATAVSYTHLDVYKRQVKRRARRFTSAAKRACAKRRASACARSS